MDGHIFAKLFDCVFVQAEALFYCLGLFCHDNGSGVLHMRLIAWAILCLLKTYLMVAMVRS